MALELVKSPIHVMECVDELRKLLSDKDAYHHFLLSLDQVKLQNNLRDELRKETLELARRTWKRNHGLWSLETSVE
ncbi:vacuolar protein-sorting-associated protein 37 homolog 1-like isoform X2 [Castanea sativa]|uniref:vacuolar protein-sorting-associated protein 37 homolog 1-like isoform X2 n=1 Tax=Castanea sativa TaxID=21020 RepID=UPI003F64CC21